MRCFVAAEIPSDVAAAVEPLLAPLRQFGDVRWTAAGQWHVTLKFLGDCDAAQVAAMTAAVAGLRFARIECTLAGLGQFPPRGEPRVLWLGIAGGEQAYAALAGGMEDAAAAIGIAREPRPFHAHLTIGRVKSPRGVNLLQRHCRELSERVPAVPFTVERVVLFESTLARRGSIYRALATAQGS